MRGRHEATSCADNSSFAPGAYGPAAPNGQAGHFRRNRGGARASAEETVEGTTMPLAAIALNCKPQGQRRRGFVDRPMIGLIVSELKKMDVQFRGTIRIADHVVKPGVSSNEGEGDEWPELRRRILEADILTSDSDLDGADVKPRQVRSRTDGPSSRDRRKGPDADFGKIALVAVVGNEDGAHLSRPSSTRRCPTTAGRSGVGGCLLGRRGDGGRRFSDLPKISRTSAGERGNGGEQCGASRGAAREKPYPGVGDGGG